MKPATAIHPGQTTYQNNLAVLKVRFPDAYRQIADLVDDAPVPVHHFVNTAGQANACYVLPDGRQILFYEKADIVAEIDRQLDAWQLGNKDFLVCIGMGLGYLPLIASQYHASQPGIAIVEPNPDILKLALQLVDLQPLLHYPKLHLVLGAGGAIKDHLLRFRDRLFFGKVKLVSHGASCQFFGESFEQLERAIVDNIQVIRNICYTAREAGPRILTNTLANLPSLFGGPDLGRLNSLLNGFPAICVAAGPSLDKDLDRLRSIGDRAVVLCCDSAVHALVCAGITPHMVVTADRLPVNFEKIRHDLHYLRNSVLVFGAEANPDNVRAFLSPRRVGVSADSVLLNRWLGPQLGLDWQLPAMTSVSHTAIFTAMKLGADPIVLVGMDFALSDSGSHARGSIFRYPADPTAETTVEGVNGRPARALPQLVTDRRQIENTVAENRHRLIDVSLSGARIRGAEIRSLQEVVDTMLNPQGGVARRLEGAVWEPCGGSAEVLPVMDKMLAAIKPFTKECRQFKQVCRRTITDRKSSMTKVFDIRNTLANFEQRHDLLMRVLQMLRYADVQTLTARMEDLTNRRYEISDPNHGLGEEVDIYADHYESLEKAALQFETLLNERIAYFKNEAAIAPRRSDKVPKVDQRIALREHYLQSGELWQAEPLYRRHLNDFPDDAKAWLALGQQYVDRQLWPLAVELLSEWRKRCTADAVAASFEERLQRQMASILKDASASLEKGHTEVARRQLTEYLRLLPDDTKALDLQYRLHQPDEESATPAANKQAIPIAGEAREALLTKAHRFLTDGQPEPAVGILEGLAQAHSDQAARFREQIGDIRLQQQDVASAAWHYHQALASDPGNSALEAKLRDATCCRSGTIGGSMTNETGMLHNDSESTPDDYYRHVREWIGTGEIRKAINVLEQLLADNPNLAQVHNDLGVLYFNDGDKDAAYRHYRQAVHLEPGNITFQKNLADFTYVVRGNVKAALEIYANLLAANPNDTELLAILGQVCADEGKHEDAELFFDLVLACDPDNHTVREMKRRVSQRLEH